MFRRLISLLVEQDESDFLATEFCNIVVRVLVVGWCWLIL